MKERLNLKINIWVQLLLVVLIFGLANLYFSKRFVRVDLTKDGTYSLDLTVRGMVWNLDKPLYAKVYFSSELEPPYNNHETILLDKLEELRAYSHGLMAIERVDPSKSKELEEEASRFGVAPTTVFYKDQRKTEIKKVYMGLAFIYGDRQETLPPIKNIETLEYDIARSLRKLLSENREKSVLGFSTGHGEPNIIEGPGPLQKLTASLKETHDVLKVELGTEAGIADEVDALWIVGPRKALSRLALYQIDQFIMRGGAVAFFPTSLMPNQKDWRTHRTMVVNHGLDSFLAHYGVKLNKDILVDRVNNGKMPYPNRVGPIVQQVQINHPLIVKATALNTETVVNRGIKSIMTPFVSSLELNEPLPPDVQAETWASSSEASGRLVGVRTYNLNAYKVLNPGERTGSFPVLMALSGKWTSFFNDQEVSGANEGARLAESARTRLVIGGSADFVANNPGLMLNLADWMVQDEDLIKIRSKVARYTPMENKPADEINMYKNINLYMGSVLIFSIGLLRFIFRRRFKLSGEKK